jgi:hypothetical protein
MLPRELKRKLAAVAAGKLRSLNAAATFLLSGGSVNRNGKPARRRIFDAESRGQGANKQPPRAAATAPCAMGERALTPGPPRSEALPGRADAVRRGRGSSAREKNDQ